jgi:hypothetical protein
MVPIKYTTSGILNVSHPTFRGLETKHFHFRKSMSSDWTNCEKRKWDCKRTLNMVITNKTFVVLHHMFSTMYLKNEKYKERFEEISRFTPTAPLPPYEATL